MKKLLALVPFFCFAACSAIRIDYTKQASAGETGGAGGSASTGSGMGGSGNAAFCACESEVEKDGDRLKRQYLIGADGSKMATGNWTDTEIGETCSFQKLPNGDTQCVPEHVPMNTFLDSACTQPMYVKATCVDELFCKDKTIPNGKCAPTARYVRFDSMIPDANCIGECTGFTIYGVDIGQQYNPIGWYVTNKDGSCTWDSGAGYMEYEFYGVYKIGDAAKFVSAK